MIAILGIFIGLFVVPDAWTIPVIAGALMLEAVETFVSRRIARRFGPPRVGPERVIGQKGRVTEPCRPRGRVQVRGESWLAHCEAGANQDDAVRVTDREGLILHVEPLTPPPGATDR